MSFTDLIRRRDPIDEKKLTWLGRAGGWSYARNGNQELAVAPHPLTAESYELKDGERFVRRHHDTILEDGARMPGSVLHVAIEVEPGTFEKMARTRKPTGAPVARPWDVLGTLPAFQRREPTRMVSGPPARDLPLFDNPPGEQELEAVAGVVDLAHQQAPTIIEVGGNQPPDRSVAGIVAWLEGRGVELSLARGHLVPKSVKPMRDDVKEVIERAEALLVGHLQSRPVICSMCAEPAITIVFPRAPMCAEHAA